MSRSRLRDSAARALAGVPSTSPTIRGLKRSLAALAGAVALGCFLALALALGGVVTGFILLGDSWFQLLMAAALGVILTQVAFLAHEAAHRQILASGPANFRLARILAAGVVGGLGMAPSANIGDKMAIFEPVHGSALCCK